MLELVQRARRSSTDSEGQLKKKEYKKAIKHWSEVIEREPQNSSAWMFRGDAKQKLGQHDAAIIDYEMVMRLDPKNNLVWTQLQELKLKVGVHNEVLQDCDKAILSDKTNVLAWVYRGIVKLKLRRFLEAIEDCERALELDSQNIKAMVCRGEAKREMGQLEEAVQDFIKVLELEPQNSTAKKEIEMAQHQIEAKQRMQKTAVNESTTNKSRTLSSIFKPSSEAFDRRAIVARAKKHFDNEEYENVVVCCDQILFRDKKDYSVWQLRGEANLNLERYNDAIKDCNEAIKLNGKVAASFFCRGIAKQRLGNGIEALQDLRKAHELAPQNVSIKKELEATQNVMAWAYHDQTPQEADHDADKENILACARKHYCNREYKEVVLCCDQALSKDLNDDSLWEMRGEGNLGLSRYKDALEDFNKAIILNRKNPDTWCGRGEAKLALGMNEEGFQDYSQAILLDGRNPFLWFMRGRHKKRLGRFAEAHEDLMRAFELDSDAIEIREELEKLQQQMGRIPENREQKADLDDLSEEGKEELEKLERMMGNYKQFVEILEEAKREANAEEKKKKPLPTPPTRQIKEADLSEKKDISVSLPVFQNPIFTSSMKIPPENLYVDENALLGRGGFGEVHKGIYLGKLPVAVKTLKNVSKKSLKEFEKEIEIHMNLDSSGVVKVYGITKGESFRLVMKLMERGSLQSVLHNPDIVLSWETKLQMAINVTKGLEYLHSHVPKIIHGDVKSANILVNKKWKAKLADFGTAKRVRESQKEIRSSEVQDKGAQGSLPWIAPEVLTQGESAKSTASDIFALAVVLWELASRLFPHKGNVLLPQWIIDGTREVFNETRTPTTHPTYAELTEKCWDNDPSKRPSAEKVGEKLENIYSMLTSAPVMFPKSSARKSIMTFGAESVSVEMKSPLTVGSPAAGLVRSFK